MPSELDELWARLRQFDPHCNITLQRQSPSQLPVEDGVVVRKLQTTLDLDNLKRSKSERYGKRAPAPSKQPPPPARAWSVCISKPDGGYGHYIHSQQPRLVDALRMAIEEAEARGWGRTTTP